MLEIVAALPSPRGLACGLHGRQQERDQDSDDGDHDQELDQGESMSRRSAGFMSVQGGLLRAFGAIRRKGPNRLRRGQRPKS